MRNLILLLGSNMDNPQKQLSIASKLLSEKFGDIYKISSVYQTKAWGNTDQADFYNQVIIFKTNLNPRKIIKLTKLIELSMGRERKVKWGPRIIDIDILFLQKIIYFSEDIIIPHPQIQNRKFTLEPLFEIVPDFIHPLYEQNIITLLKNCKDNLPVLKVKL